MKKKSDRYWRGDSCKAPSVKAPKNNLRCSVDIFNEQLKGKSGDYEGNGKLGGKGSNSYWQDLRGENPKVLTMVKKFPDC